MNLIELHKVEDVTINQLYLFQRKYYKDELYRGFVKKIEPNRIEFKYCKPDSNWETTDWVNFEDDKVWIYNATIYHKFQKLLKQQKEERENLLLNKEVVVDQISRTKWYSRFLRRKHK